MSFGAGLLTGVAGGMTQQRDRKDRERALSVLEAAQANRPAPGMDRGQYPPPGRGQPDPYPQSAEGWDASTVDPSIANGLRESAAALQMDPEELATIISYETAGTFDPAKAGPTTQWGQHRGLIQFGEPQAQQYGVDWNNPVGSQLGSDGAVVRYFRENGWQPGMGMMDAYSIVNAGGPGRYNASDANNGGAAGTVADKVNSQMGAHRAKARALLAHYGQPAPAPAPAPTATPAAGEWFTGFFKE